MSLLLRLSRVSLARKERPSLKTLTPYKFGGRTDNISRRGSRKVIGSNPRPVLPFLPGLVWPCLVWPCLALPAFTVRQRVAMGRAHPKILAHRRKRWAILGDAPFFFFFFLHWGKNPSTDSPPIFDLTTVFLGGSKWRHADAGSKSPLGLFSEGGEEHFSNVTVRTWHHFPYETVARKLFCGNNVITFFQSSSISSVTTGGGGWKLSRALLSNGLVVTHFWAWLEFCPHNYSHPKNIWIHLVGCQFGYRIISFVCKLLIALGQVCPSVC